MSYNIFCYRSTLGKPDWEEAQAVIYVDGVKDVSSDPDPETKLKIAQALIEHNPRLENFEFNYEEIARVGGISIEKARETNRHIELNSPEGDYAIQITIFDSNISIAFPYWYSGDELTQVLNKVAGYAKVIRQTAGYFVYDPQSDKVLDPLTDDLLES